MPGFLQGGAMKTAAQKLGAAAAAKPAAGGGLARTLASKAAAMKSTRPAASASKAAPKRTTPGRKMGARY